MSSKVAVSAVNSILIFGAPLVIERIFRAVDLPIIDVILHKP